MSSHHAVIDEALPASMCDSCQRLEDRSTCDEAPAVAVRRMRMPAINVAMRLVRDGEADAVVTAGHTGAGVTQRHPPSEAAARCDPTGARRPDGHPARPVDAADIGATTDFTGVNLAGSTSSGWLFSERCLASATPPWRCSRIGGERGKGRMRPGRDGSVTGGPPELPGDVEAGAAHTIQPMRSSATPPSATSR